MTTLGVAGALDPCSAILDKTPLLATARANAARSIGADLPPLCGMPVAIKDLTPMAGHP